MAYDDRETGLTVEDRGSKLGLPQNQDAEANVLAAMLLSPEVVEEAQVELQPDDFYRPIHKWIIEKLREDKRYTFGTELDRNDPRNQSEDLGDDAMLASSYGIKNLKRVMPEIMNWTYEPNEGYMKAVRLYQNVVGQFDLYMGHVATNVAGIYHNPISVEQTDMKAVEYVPKDIQKKAVDFLNKELFTNAFMSVSQIGTENV